MSHSFPVHLGPGLGGTHSSPPPRPPPPNPATEALILILILKEIYPEDKPQPELAL